MGCRRWDQATRRKDEHRHHGDPRRWCATRLHKVLREALETGAADRIGLAREFVVAVPTAGATTGRTPRRPFPDEVARALADETNLRRLAEVYDPQDRGLRDMWEITVTTGRRIGEVLQVRLGLPGPLRRAADVLA